MTINFSKCSRRPLSSMDRFVACGLLLRSFSQVHLRSVAFIATPTMMLGGTRVAIALLCLSLVNVYYIASQLGFQPWSKQADRSYCEHRVGLIIFSTNICTRLAYRGHDYPETLPDLASQLPHVYLTVEESVHFALLGEDSDAEWDSPTSAGYGYVRLGPDHRFFAVTMFHELHCLRMLNLAFFRHPVAGPEHVRHCLNYLRQGVLCSPDLTLEPGNFEDKEYRPGDSGATHVCRDWSAVYPIADTNYWEWMNVTST